MDPIFIKVIRKITEYISEKSLLSLVLKKKSYAVKKVGTNECYSK